MSDRLTAEREAAIHADVNEAEFIHRSKVRLLLDELDATRTERNKARVSVDRLIRHIEDILFSSDEYVTLKRGGPALRRALTAALRDCL